MSSSCLPPASTQHPMLLRAAALESDKPSYGPGRRPGLQQLLQEAQGGPETRRLRLLRVYLTRALLSHAPRPLSHVVASQPECQPASAAMLTTYVRRCLRPTKCSPPPSCPVLISLQ